MDASTTLSTSPTIPPYSDDQRWITTYMYVHMMSSNSRRYAYFLWIIVLFLSVVFAILHWTGSKGSFIGAYWGKWMLRRRTWRYSFSRTKSSQPVALQSNGQLLSLTLLTLATFALTFVGPDYIAPGANFWQFYQDNSQTLSSRGNTFDESLIYPYVLQHSVSKAWWTSGGRNGLIAFALFPLCILFAIKAPPFALFALPFTLQFHSDKLAWLHRWSGRLIWFITLCHVVFWTVQLAIDKRPGTDNNALHYAWTYNKFIFGWIAFGFLTLIVILSLHPIRRKYYETFYVLHVLTVPLMLITAALHHPPVWWFCWAALALWVGERTWRGIRWLRYNGILSRIPTGASPDTRKSLSSKGDAEGWQLTNISPPYHPTVLSSAKSTPHSSNPGHLSTTGTYESCSVDQKALPPTPPPTYLSPGQTYIPPPGYCQAELLSGSTVRLRFVAPGPVSWAPGQYFLVNIPSISKLTSHPFTTASVCDEEAPTHAGRILVFLIRAKSGWTKQLWDRVANLTTLGLSHHEGERLPSGTKVPAIGVLFRMYVDGPYGSAVRARWEQNSTVVIVAGGSGVSFGISVLQYLCLCMAGRNGRRLGAKPGGLDRKGFSTTRIRFIWLVREYAHIQWCASAIRKCISIIPAPSLEVNIFVTHHKSLFDTYIPPPLRPGTPYHSTTDETERLVPPSANLTHPHSRSCSIDGHSSSNRDSYVDLSYFTTEYGDEERDIGDTNLVLQNYILDLTNFDGDNDAPLPGEEALNRRVMKTGKHRREKSRKAKAAKQVLEELTVHGENRRDIGGRPFHQAQKFPEQIPDNRPQTSKAGSRRSNLSHLSFISKDIGSESGSHKISESPSSLRSQAPSWSASSAGSESRPRSFLGLSQHDGLMPSRPHSLFATEWDDSTASFLPLTDKGTHGDDIRLQVDEQEMHDVSVVSEHARPGKPKIDRILRFEVDLSQGSTIVGCCGPASLNAMVRKSIAKRIDPGKVRRGDMRGFVTFISEEFSF